MYSDRATDGAGTGENTQARPGTQTGGAGERPVDVDAVRRQEGAEVADIVNRARGRAEGFLFGNDRAIGARPNWAAHDSKQLYSFATVDNVPASAEEIGQTWNRHGGELTRIADDLYNAITELGSVWLGQGAGAAQGALVGIANSGAQASEAARSMQDRLARQAAAAAKLRSMPQPKEFDPGRETAAMLAGGPAAMVSDLKEQFDAAQETKAQQIAFLDAYTTELSEIDGTTPSFGPDSLGLKAMAGGVSAEAGNLGAVGTYGAPGGHAAVNPAGVSGVGAVGTPGAAAGAQAAPDAGYARPDAAPTPVAGTGSGTTGQAHGAPAPGAGGGGGLGVGGSLGAVAAGGVVGAAGAKALSSGRRSGSRKQEAEVPEVTESAEDSDETVASAGNRSGSSASVPTQSQGGLSTGGTIGAGAQTPPPVGGPGMTGTPVGAGGAGATAGGDDEQERTHHASFLIEPDPDETFGATGSAAPPVLGAWGPDDEER